jgi:hypothetical protein
MTLFKDCQACGSVNNRKKNNLTSKLFPPFLACFMNVFFTPPNEI